MQHATCRSRASSGALRHRAARTFVPGAESGGPSRPRNGKLVRSATMKLGLQISSFTWPGGPEAIGPTLAGIVRQADDVGFDSIWVMDHFFQIRGVGKVDEPMLKGATTLDVLSGGRAWLGIGAAWNEDESRSLGFPFPPLGERFEMLEETLQIAYGMWDGERGTEEAYQGRLFKAGRLLNSPQSLSRPRVPIMIGGGCEKKTLRLVAQYADACNVFGAPEAIARKYAILADHCAAVGRDPDEIERSTLQNVRVGTDGARGTESPSEILDRFGELSDAGAQHVIVSIHGLADAGPLELVGRDV